MVNEYFVPGCPDVRRREAVGSLVVVGLYASRPAANASDVIPSDAPNTGTSGGVGKEGVELRGDMLGGGANGATLSFGTFFLGASWGPDGITREGTEDGRVVRFFGLRTVNLFRCLLEVFCVGRRRNVSKD